MKSLRYGLLRLVNSSVLRVIVVALLLTPLLVPNVDRTSSLEVIVANALPVCLLGLLMLFLMGRGAAANSFVLLVLGTIFYLNDRKAEVLALPLSYNDVFMLEEFLKSPRLLLQYGTWYLNLLFLLGCGALLLLIRMERPAYSLPGRLLGTVAVLVVASVLLLPASPIMAYYKELPLSPWAPQEALERKGLVASLLQEYALLDSLETPRSDARIISRYRSENPRGNSPVSAQLVKPDVIVWLSESYFDPGILRQVNSCTLIPHFCRLGEKYPTGTLVVPAYAGQTVRSEFEILTGISLGSVAGHEYPYLSLVKKPINSLAWRLKELGYATIAVHTHKKAFWRRNIALPYLGFDALIGEEDMAGPERSGYFIADRVLTDQVAELLDTSGQLNGPPQLIFAISMEAHGPWGGQPGLPVDDLASIPTPSSLSASAEKEFRQYFYHLSNADAELARMVELINARERPTVMLFFGDHLPGLETVYAELGFKDGQGPRAQETVYMLASNEAAGELDFPGQGAAWQLSTFLLDSIGLVGNSQFAWFQSLYRDSGSEEVPGGKCDSESCKVLKQFQLEQLDLL